MSEQITSLEQCEKYGEIELGRGQIISQIDMKWTPETEQLERAVKL